MQILGYNRNAITAISMLFTIKNKSAKKMLNKREPSIDLWRRPKTISIHVLYELFILEYNRTA